MGNETPETQDPTINVNPDQEPDKQQVVREVMRLYEKAKRHKEKKHLLWRENWEFFLGRQWPLARPTYRASEVLNFTFSAIQASLPILTDNRPRFSFTPEDPNDMEFAQYIEKVIDAEWARFGWNQVVAEMFLYGDLFGTCLGSIKWDKDANSGLGAVRFIACDPFNVYPSPFAKDVNDGSMSYLIEAKPIPVARAKALFPDIADKIKADVSTSIPSKYTLEGMSMTETTRVLMYPFQKQDTVYAYGGSQMYQDMCMVYDCWRDDDTLIESAIQATNDLGEKLFGVDQLPMMKQAFEKKYPDGRHTVIVSGCLAYDDNNEYEDGRYPYAKYVNYQLPGEFWGLSDIDQNKSPQRIINKVVSSAMDNLTIMGNPTWIMDQGAADAEMLTNAPGLIIEKTPNTELRREPGVPLPASTVNLYELALSSFDRINGSNELSMNGSRPDGITAGVAIESLQEAAQTRLRLKARNMETCLNQLAQLYLSRIMQYYTTERWVTLTSEGGPPETFKFQIEKDPEAAGWYKATMQKYGKNINGEYVPLTAEQKQFRSKGIFDVRATVGSNLPFAKKAKAQTAMMLFDKGIIDAEELLKTIEWPGWERLVQKIKEQQALSAGQPQQAAPNQ